MLDAITVQPSSGLRTKSDAAIWGVGLVIWFVVLCVLPCPRPLSSPEWLIRLERSVTGLSEPYGRLIAALAFRSIGLFFLGGLVSLALSSNRLRVASNLVTNPDFGSTMPCSVSMIVKVTWYSGPSFGVLQR
jgi:hypothetical protein